MKKCSCSNCNKLFFYDPNLIPYQEEDDNVCRLTLYQKIMTCPHCGAEYVIDKYYKEWWDTSC